VKRRSGNLVTMVHDSSEAKRLTEDQEIRRRFS
jgi:hypothetical protein